MKRSEALLKITTSHPLTDTQAEKMLDFFEEEIGMIPPARVGALVGIDGSVVHSWEAEIVLPIGSQPQLNLWSADVNDAIDLEYGLDERN